MRVISFNQDSSFLRILFPNFEASFYQRLSNIKLLAKEKFVNYLIDKNYFRRRVISTENLTEDEVRRATQEIDKTETDEDSYAVDATQCYEFAQEV